MKGKPVWKSAGAAFGDCVEFLNGNPKAEYSHFPIIFANEEFFLVHNIKQWKIQNYFCLFEVFLMCQSGYSQHSK